MTLLRLKDVALTRGGRRILEGVSFDVTTGQAVILLGPNGIGKTTLLRVIAGLGRAQAGQVTCTDAVAYGGHLDAIKLALTVGENLTFWAQVYGAKNTAHVIEDFALSDLQTRLAAHLSAGQKRRLGLARVALCSAKLWVMDEPTVSLDVKTIETLTGLMQAHMAKGGGVVLATHVPLNIPAATIDISQYVPKRQAAASFDEAFL